MNGRKVIILFVCKSSPTFALKPFAESDTQTIVYNANSEQIQFKNKTYNLETTVEAVYCDHFGLHQSDHINRMLTRPAIFIN